MCAKCKQICNMKSTRKTENYCRHIYIRVSKTCADCLTKEAMILGFPNRSLLIRYLLGKRNLKGPLYSKEEVRVLKDFRNSHRQMDIHSVVISVKFQDSIFEEMDSEWKLRDFRSLPSYLARILESRYLSREIRFFTEDS